MSRIRWWALAVALAGAAALPAQQPTGTIRGVVYDRDFDAPLAGVEVVVAELDLKAVSGEQGSYAVRDVPAGRYTVVFAKEGYIRHLSYDVVVSGGQLTEVDARLSGDFTDMEDFVVQDFLLLGGSTEAGLLQLRFDSPSLMDSIGAELMSRAGASDAASALRLVPGATVKDGKSAVIRGLPDRYVSSQMNGVRLPTADEDKRAVELDQFPSAVIESVQVSKTFTPDQQGDASGGAVDVRLRGVPDQPAFFTIRAESGYNSQVTGRDRFLTYEGGGVSTWGMENGQRRIQTENLGSSWEGAVGTSRAQAPIDYKWNASTGGSHEIADGVVVGAFASFFYERDSSFFDDGFDDSLWVERPGAPMTPSTVQGVSSDDNFRTELFDITQSEQSVQWGGLGTVGLASEHHDLSLVYLYSRTAEDKATLAEDTRGKSYFFPGFDPNNPASPGHGSFVRAAPYVRFETLEYTERTTETVQLGGRHDLPIGEHGPFREPELAWGIAFSSATQDQPDTRQFGSIWVPTEEGGRHEAAKPAANVNLGNLQRTWKNIEEESEQYRTDLKLPFEQWSGVEGYAKVGWFFDHVDRTFDQETFNNSEDPFFEGPWEQLWSSVFPFEENPITESLFDVDYDGEQEIEALYAMLDLPLSSWLSVVGGVRFESTDISIVNQPEEFALWFPPGALLPEELSPGEADVAFKQRDELPAIGLVLTPHADVTVRASYAETIARQTFKELTPILQQEFLGGPIFIGNPALKMSSIDNYDLRIDYTPYEGGLLSASWFRKDIKDPIEYVQRVVGAFDFTTPVNYPKGRIEGIELETRHSLGALWEPLEGLACGANATFIDAKVRLTEEEINNFNAPNIQAPMTTRDMTNAPEHLYNLYLSYDIAATGTALAAFYTVTGDTLVAGAGESGINFVPSIYATEFDTLNLSISQALGASVRLQFQAKNVTNPDIQTVYRSAYIGEDVPKSSFTRGVDYQLSIGAEYTF